MEDQIVFVGFLQFFNHYEFPNILYITMQKYTVIFFSFLFPYAELTLLLYIIYIRAGYLKYDIALGTLNYLGKETKYVPWKTALNSLGFLEHILSDRPANGNFQVCTLTTHWRIVRTQRLTLIKKKLFAKGEISIIEWSCWGLFTNVF